MSRSVVVDEEGGQDEEPGGGEEDGEGCGVRVVVEVVRVRKLMWWMMMGVLAAVTRAWRMLRVWGGRW
jgi:hypothetical protein